ncbi:MAG: Protein translocase subunit SecA [candidate division WS6 bacterium GW2011_GWF2_39_15]|uniref:Protein translocase subunit SecA n=1 Tax=candidate division WS6 bacterium GW2011_GWF2_39_15 TaxID=1619100 RepID=A0A0G0MNX1_9BACT|nr:MAG: Protein translocase subunit SecA [candidate division WS6 bacterium GW2011_GWF2_39_15]
MLKLFSGIFDSNEKQINKAKPLIEKINSFEKGISKLSDEKLREKTDEFRKILKYDREKNRQEFVKLSDSQLRKRLDEEKSVLTEIIPEAFAVVREASKRVSNHRHFDVQMMAGYFLFENKVVELFTGEGKTLAANMPLYLYGLTSRGAHLVTVNDYLARRDAEWTGHILNSLGITVGVINNGDQYRFISDEEAIKLKGSEAKKLIKERNDKSKASGSLKYSHMSGVNLIECSKKEAYACDVVYGTNNEFGFDYLRDNMAQTLDEIVQGPLYFSIVDEADSILIDEARTPLIISTNAQASNDMYMQFAKVVNVVTKEKDYTVDEKSHAVSLTDEGLDKIEKALGVKNVYEDAQLAYHLDNALKAKELYRLDEEYIVRDGEVLIVDEFTGRVLPGRRYSEGLHQAIEAKEGVEVKRESRTLATITLQNYFRLYSFLAGMTGTALTEAEEFAKIYKLDVMVIPTNRPVVREDLADVVFRTQEGKFKAIVEDIKEHNKKGQPVLVGTTSVERSEILSDMLSKEGVKHSVLNAKQHEREASVVAEAGLKGQVTIATNMAGRGTDISLGEGVKDVGGLYIIGSERHESRRIDNQLRGRSGRQGDPGKSRFYVSFEDELMRLFGGDKMNVIMSSIGMADDMPVSIGLLGRSIESAQKKVEAYNYDIRKNLVDYDDVLNKQRDIIYDIRRQILQSAESIQVDNKMVEIKNKDLANIDLVKLMSELDSFMLSSRDSWKLKYTPSLLKLDHPIIFWILKKALEHTKTIIFNQLQDDMEIDKEEERKGVSLLKSMLTDELFEIAVKLSGFKDSKEFFNRYDESKVVSEKLDMLLKIVVSGFIFHINALGHKPIVDITKLLTLQTIDNLWMEHLDTMQDLREGINLRNLAQRDPLVEYKNEGFAMFDSLMQSIDDGLVNRYFKVRVVTEQKVEGEEVKEDVPTPLEAGENHSKEGIVQTTVRKSVNIGRNDPCPCGSGKKYKKCGLLSTPEHQKLMRGKK